MNVLRPLLARTLLIGLDHVWCDEDADRERITSRGFPEWLEVDSKAGKGVF